MVKYADRAFLSMNGARLADLESASLRKNKSARNVKTMTDDGYDRGFVESNWEIDINVVLAVQNQLARPKLESIDYENNDIQITWVCGADVFTTTGVYFKDVSDDAGGVGQEVKTSFNFGALKTVDTVGNSVLFNLAL